MTENEVSGNINIFLTRVDVGSMRGGCGVDVGWMWGGYGVDVGWMWEGCGVVMGGFLAVYA